MSIKYLNIKKDCSTEISTDKKYNIKELLNVIENSFNSSNLKIKSINYLSKSIYSLILKVNGVDYNFITFIKNITGAGWKDKINIRRVQVSNISLTSPDLIIHKDNKLNLIIGYYNYDDNPIFVAWDLYRYLKHNTIRSCYVTVESLLMGYKRRYYEAVNLAQKIWIFTPDKSEKFIENYINYVNQFYDKEE